MILEILAAACVLSLVVSLGTAIFYLPKMVNKREEAIVEMLDTFIKQTQEELKPILNTNSKVMGMLANKSADVRQQKSALNALGQDMIDNNELLISAVEMVSPLFADKLRSNPQLIISLLPQIKQILGNTDPDFLNKLTGSGEGGKSFKGHPFMNRDRD